MLADQTQSDRLGATHHLVVVLRLVVATGGHVLHGEVLEPARGHRFVGLTGLAGAVRDSVADWLRKDGDVGMRDAVPMSEPTGTENDPVG